MQLMVASYAKSGRWSVRILILRDTTCRTNPDNRGYEAFCLMAFFIIHLLGVCDATNNSVY